MGRKIYQQNTAQSSVEINTSAWSAGLYMIQVNHENGNQQQIHFIKK
jgi:hypothetical protein